MTVSNPQLLLDRALYWESTSPDRVFMTQPHDGGQTTDYTWRETLDQARRMATHLVSLGLPKPSQIGIVGKNSAHWIIADLAIWMAGHVSVPLYPNMATEHVRQILEHSESRLLFVGKLDDWPSVQAGIPEGLPLIELPLAPATGAPKWDQIVAEAAPLADVPRREPQEMATIIYTSGTTGTPKGVMLSFEALAAGGNQEVQDLRVGPDDRYLSYLPLAHTFDRLAGEGMGIYNGVHLYFAEALDTFLTDVQRARPTVFCSVPRLYMKFQGGVHAQVPPAKLQKLLSIPLLGRLVRRKVLKGLGLDKARLAISGAAPLAPEVIQWYRRLGLPLTEGYGMTENHSYSHVAVYGQDRLGTVGKSRPGVETRISAEGEVLVKSPSMMMGYFKAPDLTAAVITPDGFLRTGDLGEVDADGFLRITGRVKDQFKTDKGKYITPAVIEALLLRNPVLEQACVCGVGFPQPFALVMLAEDVRAKVQQDPSVRDTVQSTLEDLLVATNTELESHEKLQYLAVVGDDWTPENGLVTPTMKIKRNAIEGHYGNGFKGWFDTGRTVVWATA